MPSLRSSLLLSATLFLGLANAQAEVELTLLVGRLDSPVGFTGANDGSGRLFIVEQAGVIKIWNGTKVRVTPFLNISNLVDDTAGEQGLLGLTFHPNFVDNGFFFVNYTFDPGTGPDRTRIARYMVSAENANVADAGSAKTILEVKQDFGNHNGGDLHFGPDGFLYIGMGDGGSGGDPHDRAQSVRQLLGKMLRIDIDSSGSGDCGRNANYGIPIDNPNLGTNACGEIWAYGLRNPWRFSFDRLTGDLFIGDVGQGSREEINFQAASSPGGENYEWDCREGTASHPGVCKGPGVRTPPVLEYKHDPECSVTGGYRYRGSHGELWGTYVYGDFCSGVVWFANDSKGAWQAKVWRDTNLRIVSFGEDDNGELYLVERSGSIYRFDVANSIFTDGFESGDTSSWSSLSP